MTTYPQPINGGSDPDPLWYRLAHCFSAPLSSSLLDAAMQIMVEEGDATACVLLRHDVKSDRLVHLSSYTRRAGIRPHYLHSTLAGPRSSVWRQVLAESQPVIVRREGECSEYNGVQSEQFMGPAFATVCLLPFAGEPEVHGVLALGEQREWIRSPFTPERVRRLELATMQIGEALAHMQWQEKAQLSELGLALSASLDIDVLLKRIHERIAAAVRADLYCIGIWHSESASLKIELLVDRGQALAPQRVPVKGNLLGRVVCTGSTLLVRNARVETGSGLTDALLDWHEFASWLGVPIQTPDTILGVMAVASRGEGVLQESDREPLERIAEQASIGLANALHYHEIEEQAHRDSLTQVLNHGFFLTRLEQEVARARDLGQALSLIIVDIDHFKHYNDEYGHLVGDNILCCVAQSLRRHTKHADLVGRWGGDEFVIALPGTDLLTAVLVANRVRMTLAGACLDDHRRRNIPTLTVSAGVASLNAETTTPRELLDAADRALYQAKGAGGDQVKLPG